MSLTLMVNGTSHTVDVEPETPLLWVLRDNIGLTGTKYGCGISKRGACHTPRNRFGALIEDSAYDGGGMEEWHAPALNARSPAPIPWSQEQLVDYLFDGWEEEHGIAAGPMAPVVNHLYDQSEDDIFAIAAYLPATPATD